jgi:hypothetical protein
MRQISRRGQRQGPPRRFLMSLYARYGTVLRNPPRSRGVGDRRSFPWQGQRHTLSVRPRESGDPGAKHSNVSKSGPPLPRGRAEIVAPSVVTIPLSKSAVRLSELQIGKRKSAPVCMLRARGSPSFRLSHLPRVEGGWRADKAQCPDCSRRMSGSGRTMVHSGAPAPCGAPTGIFGLRLVNVRTGQELSVPGRFLRASPVGRFA